MPHPRPQMIRTPLMVHRRSLRGFALLPVLGFAAACASAPQAPGAPSLPPGSPPVATTTTTAAGPMSDDVARWQRQAGNVSIVRDDWGIAHIAGVSDADAVFGLLYAQAEDDFNRVETNYINAMGRLAEAEGEAAVYQDLRMKLFIDPDSLRVKYAASPAWLKALMDAYADGLNYYLYTHPEVTPRVITRFEPWMALSFSEGSIGGDIEKVSIEGLRAFYGTRTADAARDDKRTSDASRDGTGTAKSVVGRVRHLAAALPDERADSTRYVEPTGSNGFAIAPSNTANGKALLLINPHTSFFFRSEVKVESEEGLNAYGAVTWGQFFVYQGFNERAGWMHTTSGLDAVDEFLETIVERNGRFFYRYGTETRPIVTDTITVPYRTASGAMASRAFTVHRTHHGPVVREADGKWVSIALMQRPVEALSQSFLRTKARTFAQYREVMELRANSSNNTVYADADGTIALLLPQFVPKRGDRFDYRRPVDGSDPATDWQGMHALSESPQVVNPATGWIQNTNNWPYSAAGAIHSPKRENFPRYMDAVGENPRGIHALLVLKDRRDFTLESLNAAAYDPYLPAFATLIPALLDAYDETPATSALRASVRDQIGALRGWNYTWGVRSVPTSLAVFFGEELWQEAVTDVTRADMSIYEFMSTRATNEQLLQALARASQRLERDFGSWRTPWGSINRFQRLTGDIVQPFDDAAPSIPVPFTSSQWGSLASFGARSYPGTKKYYGTSGNSFVSVVEFGRDSVRAKAVSAGGESGDPKSPHFNDQAGRYSTGQLRDVYFYRSQLVGHAKREYHPGQ